MNRVQAISSIPRLDAIQALVNSISVRSEAVVVKGEVSSQLIPNTIYSQPAHD